MASTFGRPGQDLPETILIGQGGNDVVGPPDRGDGIDNNLPTKPVETNPAHEPDPTSPEPSVPGAIEQTN